MILTRKSIIALLATSLLCMSLTASRADDGASTEGDGGHGKIEFPLVGGAPKGLVNHSSFKNSQLAGVANASVGQYGIQYHNGPIMNAAGGVNVNIIWYGNWGTDTSKSILPTFIAGLNNSPYFAINTSYQNGAGIAATAKVNLLGQYSYPTTTTFGTTLTDAKILTLAKGSLGLGTISSALDPNALYLVLTAPGIKESSGFLNLYCGWHSSETMDYLNTIPTPAVAPATDMKYSFVGDAGGNSACTVQTKTSPNSNVGADAMTSVIAHELEETVTDPDGTGWWSTSAATPGYENGDLCAWNFGSTSSTGTTSTFTGAVSAASNNGPSKTSSITSATYNGLLPATLSKMAGDATGTTITFTTTATSNYVTGDNVTLPAGLPTAFATLSSTVQTISAISGRTFTITTVATLAFKSVTANTSGTVLVQRAGTTITYAGSNSFAVGDKLTVAGAAIAAYNVTNVAITVRTSTTFTVAAIVPVNTATLGAVTTPAIAGRASSTAIFTYAPTTTAFAVGDKVSVAPSVTAYTVTNATITAATGTTFTVALVVAAGTPAATFTATATDLHTSVASLYNMTLGGLNFLVQQNWANRAPNGTCALS